MYELFAYSWHTILHTNYADNASSVGAEVAWEQSWLHVGDVYKKDR